MKDAIGKNDSNNFLSCIERFNTEYYSFNAQCIEERKQIKSDLFNWKNLIQMNDTEFAQLFTNISKVNK